MTDQDRLVAGRYRLGEQIGAGAMGVVWRARDERLFRTVAVKQLQVRSGFGAERADEDRSRVMREARIAARLQHPYAVSVYDVAEHDDQPWLIMEYVPSRSLAAELAERGPLPVARVARIGSQIAAALAAAHAVGVVHRDVKPGNVLLADDGTAKITDFGISRAVGDVVLTATGLVSGTPAYLAPEVAKGAEPGSPSDVFALGSTLYAAVEGQPPFGASGNPLALLHAVAAGRVAQPMHAGPLTPVLMRLLSPGPDDRPTMREAQADLTAVAEGAAFGGGHPTDPRQAWTRPVAPAPEPGGPAVLPVGMTAVLPMGSLPRTEWGHPPTAVSGQPPRPAARPRRRRPVRLVLVVALAALVIGVGALALSRALAPGGSLAGGSAAGGGAAGGQVSASAPASAEPSVVAGVPTFAAMRGLLRAYYGLLPQSPDAAWQLLSAGYRSHGNFASYQAFYTDHIAAVSVADFRTSGGKVITAVVTFTTTAGVVTHEPYLFTVIPAGDRLVIDTAMHNGPPT